MSFSKLEETRKHHGQTKSETMMIEARSAKEGLDVCRENTPDFILVDLMMEELDSGAEFIKKIRPLRGTAPIFLVSSVGDQFDSLVDRRELGISGVFQKPLDFKVLLKTVKGNLNIS